MPGRWGWPGTCALLGFQADVPFSLKKARLFVLTSVSEGLSLAMMEAMLCGLPAVVPSLGDLGDLVVDQVNGCLMDAPDPGVCADRILELLGDPAKPQRIFAGSKARGRTAFH